MKFNKYKFREYNKNYPKFFEKEKRKLKKIFPNAKVEHIGSTSIRGVGGKGIIDINLGVKKSQVKDFIKKLIEKGYNLIESGGDGKERWFFEKDYFYFFGIRRVHVHLTLLESYTWKKCLVFRDALRRNKKLREEYFKIKKEAVSKNLENEDYKDYKSKFIEDVIKKELNKK